MRYRIDTKYMFSTRPLSLHALKLRVALICAHEKYVERARPAHGPQPAGFHINLAVFKPVLGMPKANDSRAIKRAVEDLQGDPAFEQLSISSDGRALDCKLCPDMQCASYLERYFTISLDEIAWPHTVASFHLAMRWAQARRMKAPAVVVEPSETAAMARGRIHAELPWIRRTLLPAAQRLTEHHKIELFVGARWSSGKGWPPTLRLRFRRPGEHWTRALFRKVHAGEHAWVIDKDGFERLHKPYVRLIY